MLDWLIIGLMFVATLAALGYPLLRGAAVRQAPSDQELDATLEQAVAQRRQKGRPAPPPSGACPICGAPAGSDDRFCRRCGAALGRRCPSCDASHQDGDRFCVACGAALPHGGQP
ncbi:MAG: zinc-ribbon domain-containing protein [Chloroflexi bacterium]|nr:zinc-ribbon domain-containing protein [Chloroflexota bacterium]